MNITYKEAIEILGVNENSTNDEIKSAYKKLCLKVHSDIGGTDALFRLVNDAYEIAISKKNNNYKKDDSNTLNFILSKMIVPFDIIKEVALKGKIYTLNYQDKSAELMTHHLRNKNVKSEVPIKVIYKEYKSIFHKILGFKPVTKKKYTTVCYNCRTNDDMTSLKFLTNVYVPTKIGYQEIIFCCLGKKNYIRSFCGLFKKNKTLKAKRVLNGLAPIKFEFCVKFK